MAAAGNPAWTHQPDVGPGGVCLPLGSSCPCGSGESWAPPPRPLTLGLPCTRTDTRQSAGHAPVPPVAHGKLFLETHHPSLTLRSGPGPVSRGHAGAFPAALPSPVFLFPLTAFRAPGTPCRKGHACFYRNDGPRCCWAWKDLPSQVPVCQALRGRTGRLQPLPRGLLLPGPCCVGARVPRSSPADGPVHGGE